mmetsp:Transcript_10601/g.20853  ORF Transcript_10601/g.20853 Transcript_10601/m.20853 type:complete len:241 (+) Transcript_10601:185-907(+)|eukprot:CAMPEP_0171521308 /NCGR_PEP_ID=MMETSP0959-20130129/7052_1 /TAXON_ID=87120 /ORGANISM="Aurantiochytrium limacinum, Strain ATCCMYA-1381" /LENGTH=240 /DNA_ID=CAMNT_0012061179 /DNA_START=84 /DNA_END=806 /DNA_ORIENTATION=-
MAETVTKTNTPNATREGDKETVILIEKILQEKDYFVVLGLERTASEKEVTKAYRKLALKLHPDKTSLEGAEEAFKRVATAFACLRDADSRAHYEHFGRDPSSNSQVGGANPFAGAGVDPHDIFREFFREMERANAQGSQFGTRGGPMPGGGFTFVSGGLGGNGVVINGISMREQIPESLRPVYDRVPGNLLAFLFFIVLPSVVMYYTNWMLFLPILFFVPSPAKLPLLIAVVLGGFLGVV